VALDRYSYICSCFLFLSIAKHEAFNSTAFDLGIYDQDLQKIFAVSGNGHRRRLLAKDIVRKNRRFLITTIAQWTGAREKVVAPVIIKFFQRCRALNLVVPPEEEKGPRPSVG
jgi:hypothetical protein